MPREFIHTRRVEFHETDVAGIVHFSNFFRYMEAAECAFLRELGYSIHGEADAGAIGWPRGEAGCRFSAPLRFEDQVQVRLSIAAISARTVTYQCVIRRLADEGDWTEVARGTSTAICARMDPQHGGLRAVPIPSAMREAIENYFQPQNEESSTPSSEIT
jgi:YbgC/YbaW family acyl-CoA thioester hydrolase